MFHAFAFAFAFAFVFVFVFAVAVASAFVVVVASVQVVIPKRSEGSASNAFSGFDFVSVFVVIPTEARRFCVPTRDLSSISAPAAQPQRRRRGIG
jgi:hypothetical protein